MRREIMINAPRDRVWAYVADFSRHPEWSQPEHRLRIKAPAELRVGATFSSVGHELALDWHNTATITEVTPGRRLEFVAEHDGTAWRNFFELADQGGGTRLVKGEISVFARFPMSILVTLIGPWITWETGRVFKADLARIKARLEQGAVPA